MSHQRKNTQTKGPPSHPQPPPPPPPTTSAKSPPPPTASARYQLTIPYRTPLGFELEPLLPSHDSSRCTGAKISNLDVKNTRNQTQNVQIGDVIYKIDGVIAKNTSYQKILQMIRSGLHSKNDDDQREGLSFIFERQQLHPKHSPEPKTTHNPSKIPFDASKHIIHTNNNNANSSSTSPIDQRRPRSSKKRTTKRLPHLSSPSTLDLSREGDGLLNSIVYRRNKIHNEQSDNDTDNDKSLESIQESQVLLNISTNSKPSSPGADLMAIPECEALAENDGSIDYNDGQNTTPNTQQSGLYLRRLQHDIHYNNTSVNSPSFDYSGSSHNTEFRISPLGTTIATASNHPEQSQLPQSLQAHGRIRTRRRSTRKSDSPNLSKSYLSSDSEYFGSTDTASRHSQTMEQHQQQQRSPKYDNASPTQDNIISMHDGEEDNFHTPNEEHTDKNSLLDLSCSTVYMSPLSAMKNTSTTHSPQYYTIPMSMLDYQNIRNSNSIEELDTVVRTLSAPSPPEFPALLRLAQDRIHTLQEEQRSIIGDQRLLQTTKVPHNGESLNLERREFDMSNAHEELLNLERRGVDMSNVHGEEAVVVPSHIQVQDVAVDATQGQDDEEDEMNTMDHSYMHSIVTAHAEKTDILEKVMKERDDMHLHLSSQVEILCERLEDLENDMESNETDANDRINALEMAKRLAELNLEEEQMSLAASSKEARVVLAELKMRTLEVNSLGDELQRERSAHSIALQKASAVQAELRAKVDNLTSQLEIRVQETEATRQLMEMKIESKYKEFSEQDKLRIYGLEDQLSKAREQLKILSEANSVLTSQISDLQENPNDGQFKFVEVLKEFAAAEACADALAKALAESEAEMTRAVLENERMEELLLNMIDEREFIEENNKALSEKMIKMEHELDNSRKCIHNLQHLNNQNAKNRESAKNIYEGKILAMRSQIMRAESQAINQENTKAKEVEGLTLKVQKLEMLLNGRRHTSEAIKSTSGNERVVATDRTRNIGIYSDSQSSNVPFSVPQMSSRVSVLRANGGRAGLAAKLQKSRDTSQVNHGTKSTAISNRSALQPLVGNRMGYTQQGVLTNSGAIDGKENRLY